MYHGPTIDTHAHIFDPKGYPSETFFSRYSIPKPIIRYVLAHRQPWWAIIEQISKTIFRKKIRFNAIIDILEEGFEPSVALFKTQMKEAKIDQACILMMDMGFGLPGDYEIYKATIQNFKDFLLKDHAFIPFAGIDPRRPNIDELLDEFIRMGFMGFKMYPPMGFSPNHKSPENPPWLNKNLYKLYDFCESNGIPMTVHGSPGGIRGFGVSARKARKLTHPIEWFNPIVDFPKMKLNLAHLGGGTSFMKTYTKTYPDSPPKVYKTPWANIIKFYMMEFENVWGDLSFHDIAISKPGPYSHALRQASLSSSGDRLLLGTDYPLQEIVASYTQVIENFKNMMEGSQWQMISQINPSNFLYN